MERTLSSLRPPEGWKAYLVTFKDDDVHPIEKVNMKGCVVRIFAPEDEAAKQVVTHRFGKAYYQLHDEKKIQPLKLLSYPNGVFETLHFHAKKKVVLN
jgi:hypothetical protein